MQKKKVSAKFYSHYPHIKPQFMLMDLELLSYLLPKLLFKIKPFAGLSYVLLNYSVGYYHRKFLLIHRS